MNELPLSAIAEVGVNGGLVSGLHHRAHWLYTPCMSETDLLPLERAARAMYATVKPDWDWNDPDAEPMRRMYRDNARAAFLAVMEPNAAMLRKGENRADCRSVWQAMLAAMLQGD